MSKKSTSKQCKVDPSNTPRYKWALGLILVTVLTLGWHYPLLGFIVPVAMVASIGGAFFRGRWVCGNLCPRGSFLDTWLKLISSRHEIPALLKHHSFRWSVFALLMGFMALRLAQNPTDAAHWGSVFWQMCLITSIVAIALSLRYNSRSWCAICPVGTLAGSVSGEKYPLQVDASCKSCGLCEQSCSMQLEIVSSRKSGYLNDKDCLKCSACVKACPSKGVLSWPVDKAA